jgi:hypothetical protein
VTTFVRTTKSYDSYGDYWSLVRLSGFPECHLNQVDFGRPEVYVFTYPNLETWRFMNAAPKSRKAKFVHWDLERPDLDPALLEDRGAGFKCDGFDLTWVSDRSLVPLGTNRLHVVLGSDQRLYDLPEMGDIIPARDFDWCHMSYENGRRAPVYANLREAGLHEGPNARGRERRGVLWWSKIMVNAHQTDAPVMEPLRFALAAVYRMPVVSERIADPWPLESDFDYFSVDRLGDLGAAVRALMNDPQSRAALATHLHQKLCVEWPFKRCVEEGVRQTAERLA